MTPEPSARTSSETEHSNDREQDSARERTGIAGERTIPSVNRVRSLQSRMTNVMAIALMGALGLGFLTWYYTRAIQRPAAAQQSARNAAQSRAQGDMPLPSLGEVEQPNVAAPIQATSLDSQTAASATQEPAGAVPSVAVPPPVKNRTQLALERRLAGAPYVANTATGQMSSKDASTPYIGALRDLASVTPPPTPNSLSGLLRPELADSKAARVLPTQRLLLPRGAFLDCTLETAIDSTLPGMTTCITATDTFGADGKVVLMERGTKLIGQTRGDVQHGIARIFVVWTEARTPTGVIVPLDSPGTDELGRAGLPGKVNRHFWERFGAAILISVIENASENDGTTVYDASGSLATEALKPTANIRPTIEKGQGERVQILVARDLDFSSVYRLHPTG